MDLTGRSIGNYQITDEIGRGGMAVVYRAHQPSLNRYVAVKVLPPQLSFDQEFVERFQREAQAAAKLRHPNIVVIHDVGHQDGIYFIVMEYLEGRTLKQLIEQEGSLPPPRASRIAEQIATALDFAHQQGFIHRDVKPSNIFVGQGDHVTLADFGIAKAASETKQLTRTGTLMGTPEYISPEQAEGGPVDHRSDLYALGVVLYQMLVGRAPFQGTTPHATLHAVIYEPPPPPRFINPETSPAIEAVILKAIAKQPEQRFQRGKDLVSALNSALAAPKAVPHPAVAVPPPPSVRPKHGALPVTPPASRSPVAWIVACIATVLVIALAAFVVPFIVNSEEDQALIPPTNVAGTQTSPPTEPRAQLLTSVPTKSLALSAPSSEPPAESPRVPTAPPVPPTDTLPPPTNPPPPAVPTQTPIDTPTPPMTPSPTLTPSASPTPCAFPAQGIFSGLWQTYRTQLGCPIHRDPKPVQDAEQAFENGHMFWRQDTDYAYVVYENGSLSGTFQAFTGMWSEGAPEYSCAALPPPDRVQPMRGFGAVWCVLGGPRAAIGWGTGEEVGFGPGNGEPLVQDFEQGFIFRDSDGTTKGAAFVFFSNGMKFVRPIY